MRPFHFDTEFTVYRVTTSLDTGGAHIESESNLGTYLGKYDHVGGLYAVRGVQLSPEITGIMIANDCPVENGDILVTAVSRRFRVDAVDRSTLRGTLKHIEIYLREEDA